MTAKEYFDYFTYELSDITNEELIERFNREVGIRAFGVGRQGYLWALRNQLEKRQIDFSEVGDEKGISYANKVLLVNNKMIKKTVTLNYQGTEIIGEILELDHYFIRVQIIAPYCNWNDCSVITCSFAENPHNFMKSYDEVSKRLLLNSYRKLKIMDEDFAKICYVYEDLLEEINEVEKLNKSDIKNRVFNKLNDWFFNDFIFKTRFTNLIATIYEVPKIIEIIETYKSEKRKLFLK